MRAKTIAVIIVAAGRGERASSDSALDPKQYRSLLGVPVLTRTVRAFLALPSITHILPVIHVEHGERYEDLGLADDRVLAPVFGGATRQASVLEGLKVLAKLRPDLVLIQDAARPLASVALIEGVVAMLSSHDAAVPAIAVTDTIKRSPDGVVVFGTEDRRMLFSAQTPQGFRFSQIFSAHMRAATNPRQFTDDAEIAEWAGLRVALAPGHVNNIKITHPEDFDRAERIIMGSRSMETRIGSGFDVHSFEPGTEVWLAGVRIDHTHKLNGHSDSDVALHALTDAIYGAIGQGDIGTHFPPSDMQWKGAASSIFLKHAVALVAGAQGRIVNLDVTIVCEQPRIAPHVAKMRDTIAQICGIAPSRVAIKATTSEGLGFTGRQEGIVAMASASIELPRQE